MAISSAGARLWGLRQSAPRAIELSRSANASTAARTVSPVAAHQFGPNDPLNQYLTADDRSTIKAATGIDVRPDGTVSISMSSLNTISVNDTVAAMNGIGQLAADRANGTLTGPVSADYLTHLIKNFSSLLAANQDPFRQ